MATDQETQQYIDYNSHWGGVVSALEEISELPRDEAKKHKVRAICSACNTILVIKGLWEPPTGSSCNGLSTADIIESDFPSYLRRAGFLFPCDHLLCWKCVSLGTSKAVLVPGTAEEIGRLIHHCDYFPRRTRYTRCGCILPFLPLPWPGKPFPRLNTNDELKDVPPTIPGGLDVVPSHCMPHMHRKLERQLARALALMVDPSYSGVGDPPEIKLPLPAHLAEVESAFKKYVAAVNASMEERNQRETDYRRWTNPWTHKIGCGLLGETKDIFFRDRDPQVEWQAKEDALDEVRDKCLLADKPRDYWDVVFALNDLIEVLYGGTVRT